MEQNLPLMVAKTFRKILRIACFMLRKGVSKAKLVAHLSMITKRGKIASKAAIHSLAFHHHHKTLRKEHEFDKDRLKRCRVDDENVMAMTLEVIKSSACPSPALPGFGPSPMVRQLRVTDSPFPLRDSEVEDCYKIDEAAEEFITRFYKELKMQNTKAYLEYYS